MASCGKKEDEFDLFVFECKVRYFYLLYVEIPLCCFNMLLYTLRAFLCAFTFVFLFFWIGRGH